MIRVDFQDLSGYGENTVFAQDAPVVESVEVKDMAEAFEYAMVFGDEYQVAFVPITA